MRQRLDDPILQDPTTVRGEKKEGMAVEIGANYTVSANHPPVLSIKPDAARDVVLPTPVKGLQFTIYNEAAGAFALTVKQDTTTVGSLSQGKAGLFFCAEDTAGALQWRSLVGA